MEAMLSLPFILLMILLLFASGEFLLLKIHNAVEARTYAWRSAIYDADCSRLSRELFLGRVEQSAAPWMAAISVSGLTRTAAAMQHRWQPLCIGPLRRAPRVPSPMRATCSAAAI